jgi:adenylate cyclase
MLQLGMKSKFWNIWYRFRFAVFVTLLSLALLYLRYGQQEITDRLALWGNDLIQWFVPHSKALDVVIVEVTEEDTKKKGQWPWARSHLADLVKKLRESGAGVIVFADLFKEPDLAKADGVFANAILNNGVVLARQVRDFDVDNPVPELSQSAAAVGFNNAIADPDGVVRRMDLVTVNDDRAYYSLGIEALRVLTGDAKARIQHQNNTHTVDLTGVKPWIVPNNNRWRIKFNHDFVTINATSTDFSAVKNKIVIVGVATQQVNNWVQTPTGARRNHQVQAQFIQSLFDRNNVVTPTWADMLEMLISILIIASILKAAKQNTPYACIPVYAGGVGVVILGAWMLFNASDLAVDWVWPTLSSTSVFALTFYYHLARKRSAEWSINRKFGDCVGSSVLKKLKQNPAAIKTDGELKEITVLYADLRDFSGILNSYRGNSEGLVKLVHGYMDQMLPAITRNFGTVDKLIGDGVVAFWNAPLDVEKHAIQAVRGAMDMLAQVSRMNALMAPEESRLCLDIGINTGPAVIGNTGSRRKFNYTAMGTTVRTADNLENLCKHYSVNILIGEHTAAQVRDEFRCVELDTVSLEGGEFMRVFTVLDEVQYSMVIEQHIKMLELYYAHKHDAALKLCKELKNSGVLQQYYTDMLSRIRTSKIKHMEENTPNT